jgi:hypothetical protein
MIRMLCLAASVAVMCTTRLSAAIIITDPGDASIATGIKDLNIMGTVFDVDFTRALESFDTIFGLGNPPTTMVPFFYDDPAGAAAAADAIGAKLEGNPSIEAIGDVALFSSHVDVPFYCPTTCLVPIFAESYGVTSHDRTSSSVLRDFAIYGYPIFTVSPVPEASSFATCLVGLSVLFGYGAVRPRRSSPEKG